MSFWWTSSQSRQSSQSQNPSSLLRSGSLRSEKCLVCHICHTLLYVFMAADSCPIRLCQSRLCRQSCSPTAVCQLSVQGVTWRSMRLHRFFERLQKLLQLQNYSVGAHMFGGRTVVTALNLISSGNHCQRPSLLSVKTQMRRTRWEIHGNLSNRDGPWWTEQDDASWTGMVWRHDGTSVI